jgi:hypothetical protein
VAHFAKINDSNKVTEILTIDNNDMLDSDGIEQEALGVALLNTLVGDATWKKTSYNNNIRGCYATVGGDYLPEIDEFRPEKEHASWIWSPEICYWIPPIPMPTIATDAFGFPIEEATWDEDNTQWLIVKTPKVHYANYDIDNKVIDMVTVFEMYVLNDGEVDDALGIEIAIADKGEGDWRRITTPPE